jgi:hypothetical protein
MPMPQQPPVDPKGPLSEALLQAQLEVAETLTRKAQGSDVGGGGEGLRGRGPEARAGDHHLWTRRCLRAGRRWCTIW